MAVTFNPIERRILGVLIEKALAQPQYYPMSVNSIVTACNQKSNRDPLLDLDEDAVWSALEVLRAGGLVTRLMPGGSSRVERYRHELKERFAWEKPQRAVLAELLLRGPQTVGELRGRCARMYPFETTEAVAAVLDSLSQADPPAVAMLPRMPGQSTVRWAHSFYPPDELAATAHAAPTTAGPPPTTAGASTSAPSGAVPAGETYSAEEWRQLSDKFEAAQEELRELRAELADVRRRLVALEQQIAE